MRFFMRSEVYCPARRWWWPWHRWEPDGDYVTCRRCHQGRKARG